MANEDALSKVQAELDTYAATKAAFKAAIASKGMTPTDVFASYAPLIESITGGTVAVQDEKTVTFNGVTVEVAPDDGYDGIRKVILAGDPNLRGINIVDAITMYGVTGSAKVAVSEEWPDDLPITPDEPVGPAQEIDPDLPDDAETWDYFILSQNDGNITLGIMYDDFEITSYDPVTTNFSAKGWIRVSKHTTGDKAGQTLAYDFRTNASEGGNYLRNIRSCTREKLYYQGVEIWPNYNLATMAMKDTWYKGSDSDKGKITQINILDSYEPTGNETKSWNADAFDTGAIKCYVDGTILTISGNGSGKITASYSSSKMFSGFTAVKNINNIRILDTSNVTSMFRMFGGCNSLTSLDLSNFNTENVTDMYTMFGGCNSLTSLDLSNFNTENVTDMGYMFSNCNSLTSLDLSNFNTENVTGMPYMFTDCNSLTSLDVSSFNTENVRSMYGMFTSCNSLTSLDLSNFNTGNVTAMDYMFIACDQLDVIYVGDGWNTSNATTYRMFERCGVSSVTRV